MAEPEDLRSRARRYRDLATTFVDPRTVQILLDAAHEYDRRAGELEIAHNLPTGAAGIDRVRPALSRPRTR